MQVSGQWDLTALYQGLDDPAIEKDFENIQDLVDQSKSFFEEEREAIVQAVQGLALSEEISEQVRRLGAFLSLMSSADTSIGKT
ncbi:MAG: M3 family oligoendopeptidase, partial [Clostridiaceae bacterium]|nr:M3 family oligoendopeptidase [Clostridiaceae bacterium]